MMAGKNLDNQKAQKLKQFQEFHHMLDKMKYDFMEKYTQGPRRRGNISVTLNDFEIKSALGKGSFGRVVLCKHKGNNNYYAMKVMSKAKIITDRQFDHTLSEMQILFACDFPFLINMEFSFKDNCNVFFVLPFIAGGDMFSLLRKNKTFKEKDAKFYGAQIILGIEYLHYMDIVYRDLKPENIVIDVQGYIKLADFGFCKMIKLRTYTLCGTPEYLAPEIILSKGYGKSVDWWAVGVLLYELIAGYTPFYAESSMKIYEKITIGKVTFTPDFSAEARELIRNILQVDITKRYGNMKDGVYDIKSHDWFKMVDWIAILNKTVIVPYIPIVDSPSDITNFDNFQLPDIEKCQSEKYTKEFEDF